MTRVNFAYRWIQQCVCAAAMFFVLASAAEAEEQAWTKLNISDGSEWAFLGGDWTQDANGQIWPADQHNLHSRAFSLANSYDDATVEFEYNPSYRENGSGDVGFILRASDAQHYYYVSFPWGPQAYRAKHYWAAVSKVEGDGYIRHIKTAWVPGVSAETSRWYKVRIEAKGPKISVWVDGRFALSVEDETYTKGRLGMAGYGWYTLRNPRVMGHEVASQPWDQTVKIAHYAKEIPGSRGGAPGAHGDDDAHEYLNCRLVPNGDVLLLNRGKIFRSTDKGLSWNKPAPLPEKLQQTQRYATNTLHLTAEGRLIIYTYRSPGVPYPVHPPVGEIFISESKDYGHTWSDPKPSKISTQGWPDTADKLWPYGPLRPYGPLVETADGALVSLLIGTETELEDEFTNVNTWGAIHIKGYSIRSTDGGASWSGPVDLDSTATNGIYGKYPGALDFTEATGVANGNKITVLVRPIYSPMMWQCQSNDGGVTWQPAVRATFPGYAQAMLRLKSGPILVSKRFPNFSVNISRDEGVNWGEDTVIDYPPQANGCMVEVEPDVVLCIYMDASYSLPLLSQRFRVTDQKLVPVD